jgi:tetratricopeptide (TPR) repeat protein
MLRKPRIQLYLLLALSLVLIVLFLSMPKQPAEVRSKMDQPLDADSVKLANAIELVNGPNPMEGITILRELEAKDSTNTDVQYWLGVFSVRSGQVEKAIKRYNNVIRLEPTYLAAYIDLGGLYLEMDSAQKALSCFEQGISIDSTNNYALLFAAQTQEKLGMLAEAKENYEQLLRHNEDTIVTKRVNEFIQKIDTKLNP